VIKKRRSKNGSMPFLEHIRELRMRLIISFLSLVIASIIAFIFYKDIINILSKPLEGIKSSVTDQKLFVNSIYEGFLINIKISILVGLILSLPVHLYNAVKFIFPGLKPKERKIVLYSLLSSFFLIIISAYYGYFKLIPFSIKFLTGSGFVPERVGLLLNYGKNIFYIFQFLLAALLIFQLPLILELLLIMGIIKRRTLWKISRYIIVGIFIISAIATPPDVVSQVGFALPLIGLFFLALFVAKIFKFGED